MATDKQESSNEGSKSTAIVPAGPRVGTAELLGTVIGAAQAIGRKGAAFATGVAAAEESAWMHSAGNVLQAAFSWTFAEQVKREWRQFEEKGRIKPDYEQTVSHAENLSELLELLESGPADRHTFDFFKKLFLVASTESIDTRESSLPRHYLRIAKTLSGGDVMVLVASSKTRTSMPQASMTSASTWVKIMQEQSGLVHEELIEQFESSLIEKGLFTRRRNADRSGVEIGKNGRLTGLGAAVCAYLEQYESITQSDAG